MGKTPFYTCSTSSTLDRCGFVAYSLTFVPLQDIDGTLRACITTGVAIASLRKAFQTHRENDIGKHVLLEIAEPGKRYHDWWVLPKITVS